MRRLLLPAVLALAGCASAPAPRPPSEPARGAPPATASAADGGFETGRLTAVDQAVRGPFVLTYLSAGAELEIVSTTAGGAVLGRVAGPLAGPLHVASGALLRLAAPGDAVYAGHRPMPLTRALESYIGRQILVAPVGAQPEQWTLRQIGGDHLTIERSRTYRILPTRRIAEITWTDLTGIDPTPRIVLAAE
jgi:hypothetical protein